MTDAQLKSLVNYIIMRYFKVEIDQTQIELAINSWKRNND